VPFSYSRAVGLSLNELHNILTFLLFLFHLYLRL
jgi:hypothetical protein